MRWLFIILSVIGMGYMAKLYCPKFFATTVYTVKALNFGITYGMLAVFALVLLGTMKLKFGK